MLPDTAQQLAAGLVTQFPVPVPSAQPVRRDDGTIVWAVEVHAPGAGLGQIMALIQAFQALPALPAGTNATSYDMNVTVQAGAAGPEIVVRISGGDA